MNATGQFHDIQLRQTHQFMLKLFDDPSNFRNHLKHWIGASIIEATYGLAVQPDNDPLIALVNKAMEGAQEAGIPGTFLVNVLPILKYVPAWFPGATFQVKAKNWRKYVERAREVPFQASKALVESGTVPVSFVTLAVKKLYEGKSVVEEDVIKHASATTFGAGSDTSASALALFFAAMALYPDVQRKAQAELHTVVGSERLPTFDDMKNLPYVVAILKEILRWQPVLPLALPHMSSADDTYRGYHIPKGVIIMGNTWSISRNEKYYTNADIFNPDRFMKDGQLNPDILDSAEIAFGFGRRQCPGRHFAQDGLFIVFATTLACFKVEQATDEKREPVPVDLHMTGGMISHPEDFRCSIIPLPEGAGRDMVQRSLEAFV